jgi:hypothetical protein
MRAGDKEYASNNHACTVNISSTPQLLQYFCSSYTILSLKYLGGTQDHAIRKRMANFLGEGQLEGQIKSLEFQRIIR